MLGVALLGAYDMLLPATLVCALVIHWGVIRREEAYLEARFGDPYRILQSSRTPLRLAVVVGS